MGAGTSVACDHLVLFDIAGLLMSKCADMSKEFSLWACGPVAPPGIVLCVYIIT